MLDILRHFESIIKFPKNLSVAQFLCVWRPSGLLGNIPDNCLLRKSFIFSVIHVIYFNVAVKRAKSYTATIVQLFFLLVSNLGNNCVLAAGEGVEGDREK
jgi:hypothetical protein